MSISKRPISKKQNSGFLSSGEKSFRLKDIILKIFRYWISNYKVRNKFINSSHKFVNAKILLFEEQLGFKFMNKDYYIEALTHRSFVHTFNKEKRKSNERLEFLGDSVLNLIVGEFIYNKFDHADEGFLTKLRSLYVNKENLAEVAQKLKLSDFLFLSENAQISLTRGASSIISDAVEAIIGAIYLDRGKEYAEEFIKKNIIYPNLDSFLNNDDKNYKSKLLEYVQLHKIGALNYHCINEDGPEHARIFTVELLIEKDIFGIGRGRTKKQAEQEAAMNTLKLLKVL